MENQDNYRSRTQIKKEYKEIQKLGLELSKLSPQQLKLMNLPEELLEALEDAKTIKSPPAAKRQSQYIGSLIGALDPTPIKETLKLIKNGKPLESPETIETRNWIEKFFTGDTGVIEEFLSMYPEVERQTLRQLVKNSIKERDAGKIGKERKSLKGLKKLIVRCLK